MPNLTPQKPNQAMTPAEVHAFNAEAEKTFSIREKTESRSVPVKDDLGQIYRWEHDLVPCGVEVFLKQQPSAELMAFVQRPASDAYIGKVLSELTAHKPYARGQEAFAVVVRDLVHDLAGMSHWALRKVCEQYRQDASITFFPDTAQFVQSVKRLDEQLRWKGEAVTPKRKPENQRHDPYQPATTKQKRRVALMVKMASKPKERWTTWEKRFFAAMGKK